MKLVIYGLPCAGKDTLISQMGFVNHIRGSQWLNDRCGGNFRSLDHDEQDRLRREFAEFIVNSDEDIVVDGHFAFPSDDGFRTVFTQQDASCYDVFAYLDTAPDIILQRILSSDKNSIYSGLTVEDIEQWRDFEVDGLRSECLRMGKEFILLDPRFDCLVEFLSGIFDGSILTSPAVSRLAADRILKATDKNRIVLSDGDKTLTDYDLTRSIDLPELMNLKDVFYGDRYTTFQFWYVYRAYGRLPQLDEKMREAADRAVFNTILLNDLSKIDSFKVVVTAGLEILWSLAAEKTGIMDMAIGTDNAATRNMSQFSKAFIARYLRDAGREVIALGDNMVDYQMLREADKGYVIAHLKRNASVQKAVLHDNQLKQPSSNETKFDYVQEVKSIHEDIE